MGKVIKAEREGKRKRQRQTERDFFEHQSKYQREPTLGYWERQLLRQQISASCLVDGLPSGIITCDYFQAATFIPLSRGPAFY